MIRKENGIEYRRRNGVIYLVCGISPEQDNTKFDDAFENLSKILSLRAIPNYGSNTEYVRKNIKEYLNKLSELRTAILIGKKVTAAVLQSIPLDLPLLFVTSRNEKKEVVAIKKENFETQWSLLQTQIQEWLKE